MSQAMRRAVIDVGTNSVKVLIADVDGSEVTPVAEESNQTRLGAGFYATHQLRPSAMAKTAEAVSKYAARATAMGAVSVRVIATSAARDALNATELVDAVQRAAGLSMEILTGQQEADGVFRGVTSQAKLARVPVLILDVGGGSTEFIVGENSVPRFSHSYALGSVRLLEKLQPEDPPGLDALARCRAELQDFLGGHVAPELEPALSRNQPNTQLVGTGGTAAILARMENGDEDFQREKIEATTVSLPRVRAWLEDLWRQPLASRQKIKGLPRDRADVILTGTAIYEAIMQRFGFAQLQISTRGLRYWALLQAP